MWAIPDRLIPRRGWCHHCWCILALTAIARSPLGGGMKMPDIACWQVGKAMTLDAVPVPLAWWGCRIFPDRPVRQIARHGCLARRRETSVESARLPMRIARSKPLPASRSTRRSFEFNIQRDRLMTRHKFRPTAGRDSECRLREVRLIRMAANQTGVVESRQHYRRQDPREFVWHAGSNRDQLRSGNRRVER